MLLAPVSAQAQPDEVVLAQAAGTMAWRGLTAEQQAALQPLQKLWPSLGADQQRKWVALAYNFNRMTPDERATLQSRMKEWARLTPAQRTQARLNFGEVQRRVPADERRAKWEEYQALPIEERERLASDQPKPLKSAAPALRPTRPAVSAGVPSGAAPAQTTPPVNRHTLLPERAPASR
ncbi:MAG: DUF3106 domain-containing protein [Pseudomonadota bacterium]|nr:DUF3106 domain-containing protein [Pseudomonadota bacterium]